MCGIAGIIGLNHQGFHGASAIAAMATAMRHRGPDDEGYIITQQSQQPVGVLYGNETASTNDIPDAYRPTDSITTKNNQLADAFFAHRRLSIVDLHGTGHQPMSDSSGRYWIVYNGEVYNYGELADSLRAEGVTLYSNCDTEVVLHAYLRWGEQALQMFNGMFAFAIWDNEAKTVFFARDRIGIKPLFYTINDNKFIFASDIKTIIASGYYHADLDIQGLYHAMSYGAAPRPMTTFKNVKSLEAGHWLKLTPATGQYTIQQYWDIPINQVDNSLSEAQAVALLDEALHESIKYRLHSDVPVGTFMSGGIDSTTVSAIAAEHHPHIKAFTLGYSGKQAEAFNELEQAKATASMYDIDHIISIVEPESVLNYIDETVASYEEPFFSLSPNYIISKLVADNNVKVVLNGLGGDELFAGYQTFHIAKYHRFLKLLYPLLKCAKMAYPRLERTMDLKAMRGVGDLHGALMNNMSSFQKNKLFNVGSVQGLCSLETIRDLYIPQDKTFGSHIEAMCYMYVKNYIGNHHTYRVDQFTMAFSIEGRFPFLDHNFVELAFKIPARLKMQGHVGKYILRQLAQKYIHPSCLKMSKKGFDLPMDYWIHNTLHDFVHDKLSSLSNRDLFNGKFIHKVAKNYQRKLTDDYTLWQLVGVELWLEKFIDTN
ncbi:MAG: asparagine synthase (glutamine-hydrolyzing) [Legionellales bacterium]|nr:asparagine synthase (glutamine-hydrolyzing) [Legionellales bacterium]|tara:strand:- start:22450 stop:24417 length:1968 start_codon:yes stop_codon:yes gene_type:complete